MSAKDIRSFFTYQLHTRFGTCDFLMSAIIVNKSSLENFGLKTKRSLECSNESTATTNVQVHVDDSVSNLSSLHIYYHITVN